jgi:hypothetical protein
VISPTVILLIEAANGPADPAAKVAEPKMAAARASPPARPWEELTENRRRRCPLLKKGE